MPDRDSLENERGKEDVKGYMDHFRHKTRLRMIFLAAAFVILVLNAFLMDFIIHPLTRDPDTVDPLPPEEITETKNDNAVDEEDEEEIRDEKNEDKEQEIDPQIAELQEKIKLIGVIAEGEIKGQIREDEEKGVILEGEKKGELLDAEEDHAVFVVDNKVLSRQIGENVHEDWRVVDIELDRAILESPEADTIKIEFDNYLEKTN